MKRMKAKRNRELIYIYHLESLNKKFYKIIQKVVKLNSKRCIYF